MMRSRDAAELVALGALWGGSFLFMRIGTPEFGPLPLVFLRVAGATALLLPLLAWRGQLGALRRHVGPIALVGLVNTALPFALFNVAALVLGAGLMGIFNATAPLWGALVAWVWLGQRPGAWRGLGLAVGFAGVLLLVGGRSSLQPGPQGTSPTLGIAACLAATLAYGFAVNYTRQRLSDAPPLAVAAGSQLAACLLMAGPAWWTWPAAAASGRAWAAAVVLALACTGLAYLLYFRLIAQVGPAQAITVTYLIPAFAMLWGALVLGEAVTPLMLAGAAVILVGTALASGLLTPRLRRAPAAR
jgi:drug/metabolite transporter (DMT)-like permease